MRTVVIELCDNDFGSMFRPLLASVAQVLAYRADPTREFITSVIFAGLEYHYLAYQGWPGQTKEEQEQSLEYLRGKIGVLFDDEAEAAVMQDHDHGSWWLDVATGRVASF